MEDDFKVRQGDVMIRRVDKLPAERTLQKDGALAYGEVTGHSHRVADLEAAQVFNCGKGKFLSVTAEGGVSIVHEEHGTVHIPKGDYAVTIQREYSPEEIRSVID